MKKQTTQCTNLYTARYELVSALRSLQQTCHYDATSMIGPICKRITDICPTFATEWKDYVAKNEVDHWFSFWEIPLLKMRDALQTCIQPSDCTVCKEHHYSFAQISEIVKEHKPHGYPDIHFVPSTSCHALPLENSYVTHFTAHRFLQQLCDIYELVHFRKREVAPNVLMFRVTSGISFHGYFVTRIEWLWMMQCLATYLDKKGILLNNRKALDEQAQLLQKQNGLMNSTLNLMQVKIEDMENVKNVEWNPILHKHKKGTFMQCDLLTEKYRVIISRFGRLTKQQRNEWNEDNQVQELLSQLEYEITKPIDVYERFCIYGKLIEHETSTQLDFYLYHVRSWSEIQHMCRGAHLKSILEHVYFRFLKRQ